MPFRLPLLTDALPWVAMVAVFLGLAASRATRRTATHPDPERARNRKWVLVCIWLSVAILLLVGEVLAAGIDRLRDIRLAYVASAVFALAFLGSRFLKSVGVPALVIALAAILALGLFLQSIRAFTGETEIARVSVVSARAGSMELELLPASQQTQLVELRGEYFAPVVKVVIFGDLWVFLGARTWYRFVGIAPFIMKGELPETSGPAYQLPRPLGISEALWSAFEANESWMPGVKTVQTELVLKRAQALRSWSVRIQNDGGVEVVPVSR